MAGASAARATRPAAGSVVARLLAGAWRAAPPPLELPPGSLAGTTLRDAEAVVLGGGCGALVWRRLRDTPHATLAEARAYQAAFRHQVLGAALVRRRIAAAVGAARRAGVEPLLLKGWATSRRYPEPGLRPPGDVDLCIPPADRAAVASALAATTDGALLDRASVDLHTAVDDLADRPLDGLLERSESAPLGDEHGTSVRVLCVEDHLRHLALHLLRHGAWRPLWLCDVALVAESEGSALDWELCLRGTRENARRVAYVLGLARQLLDCELPATLPASAARDAASLPRWLRDATIAQWGAPYRRYTGRPIGEALTRPSALWRALADRWPNAVEATVSVGAPFNRFPRLPIQLGEVARRAARAAVAARRSRRGGPAARASSGGRAG